MSDNGLARVHFYPKQYLGPKDFEDEQRYHLARLRQHQIGHHSWGIVRGLELALNTDKTGLVIKPGVAVDGYGRLLVLGYEYPLSEEDFEHRDSNMLDVWLVYALQESDLPQPGSSSCDTTQGGKNGANAPFTRWQEQPVARLTVPNSANPIEPRQPQEVPQANWNFAPTRVPPDSPLDAWPVYLGRAARTQDQPRGPFTYTPNLTGRPYAGLVGEVIRHPAGRAWVQIGSSQAQDPDDIRFAVFIENPTQENSTEQARLEIDKGGEMTVRGSTTVEGDIFVSGGGVTFGAGKSYDSPRPWRFYRAAGDEDGKSFPEQWRLELEPDGEFSIGYFSSKEKKYKHSLRVGRPPSGEPEEAWAVTIEGDLHVTGQIRENVLVPPELAVEAQTLVTQAFMAPLFGQVVAQPRIAKQPSIDLTKVETQQQISLLAHEVFETNPGLAKNLALALINQDVELNLAKEVTMELTKQDTSLALAKELAVAVTQLIKPENVTALKNVKKALNIK